MLKKVLKIIQRIIVSILFLYTYNLVATPIDLIIPINIVTVLLLTVLGMPAIFALIAILFIVY